MGAYFVSIFLSFFINRERYIVTTTSFINFVSIYSESYITIAITVCINVVSIYCERYIVAATTFIDFVSIYSENYITIAITVCINVISVIV
ncbi:hypothetical protein FACS189498_3810 [Spirochaetia bacterium]|nr:hypothetical protein FACS189498_3810 [Spirochaetia bacterium]